jgi:hypothetical protein
MRSIVVAVRSMRARDSRLLKRSTGLRGDSINPIRGRRAFSDPEASTILRAVHHGLNAIRPAIHPPKFISGRFRVFQNIFRTSNPPMDTVTCKPAETPALISALIKPTERNHNG